MVLLNASIIFSMAGSLKNVLRLSPFFLNCRCVKMRSMTFYFSCCSTSVLLDRRSFYHICLCAICQFIGDGKLMFGGNDGLTVVRGKIMAVDAHHVGETGELEVVAVVCGHKEVYANYFYINIIVRGL